MPDDTTPSSSEAQGQGQGRRGAGSGGRDGGNREPGGFRIRLSDNEMRSARAIQESFGLRSTVAALGFAIRTLGQLLEEGQLEALVAQQRANQGAGRHDGPKGGSRRGENRRDGGPEGRSDRPARVDPFARPARPAQAPTETDQPATPTEPLDSEVFPSEEVSTAEEA